MAQTTRIETAGNVGQGSEQERSRTRLIAAGSILGALAASSCCILPLALFSLGISGAWIANFTALAPYKPYVAAGTLALLGYGYYLVYAKPTQACADGSCVRPLRTVLSSRVCGLQRCWSWPPWLSTTWRRCCWSNQPEEELP